MCSVGHSVCSDAKMHLTNEAFKKRRADSFKNFPFPIFFESEFFRSVVLRKQNFLLSTKKFSNHSSMKLKDFFLNWKVLFKLLVSYQPTITFSTNLNFLSAKYLVEKFKSIANCFRFLNVSALMLQLDELNSSFLFSRNFWNFNMHVGNKYDFVRTIIKQFFSFLFS